MENLISNLGNEFQAEIYAKTKKYQKKYGFDIGQGKHDTWNNEADAFKHAFMQAITQYKYGSTISNAIGDIHELDGVFHNQPNNELNMDLWNNEIGRNIGKEIKNKLSSTKKSNYSQQKVEDMIAEEIIKKMRNGELITNPNDKRVYFKKKFGIYEIQKIMNYYGIPTGYATNIPKDKIFTAEEIGNMSIEEFKNGTMIWVDDYVRADGTKVSGYYRRK